MKVYVVYDENEAVYAFTADKDEAESYFSEMLKKVDIDFLMMLWENGYTDDEDGEGEEKEFDKDEVLNRLFESRWLDGNPCCCISYDNYTEDSFFCRMLKKL